MDFRMRATDMFLVMDVCHFTALSSPKHVLPALTLTYGDVLMPADTISRFQRVISPFSSA